MNTTKKLVIAVVALALALVAFASVSLAWLVSKPAPVVNTFTVGDITITLDEADVTEYGAIIENAARVTSNEYKLVPGQTYTKDPIVHVAANNEKCYVFVTVDNAIADLEADDNTIEAQIAANLWTKLEVDGKVVYYKVVDASATQTDLTVFTSFTIDGSVTKADLTAIDLDDKTDDTDTFTSVTVTAYAIQYASFEDNPSLAWTTVFTAANE